MSYIGRYSSYVLLIVMNFTANLQKLSNCQINREQSNDKHQNRGSDTIAELLNNPQNKKQKIIKNNSHSTSGMEKIMLPILINNIIQYLLPKHGDYAASRDIITLLRLNRLMHQNINMILFQNKTHFASSLTIFDSNDMMIKNIKYIVIDRSLSSDFIIPPNIRSIALTDQSNPSESNQSEHLNKLLKTDGCFPAYLLDLTFNKSYNDTLTKDTLPRTLATIRFGEDFNQPLTHGVLPNTITSITFGESYNQPLIPGVLPINLNKLVFGNNFNQIIGPNVLPQELCKLIFGHSFDQPIETKTFPESLQSIVFGRSFNQPLGQGVLPQNLKRIKLGDGFICQKAENFVLPGSLTSIHFGRQPLEQFLLTKDLFPHTGCLVDINFGDYFNQILTEGVIPSSVIKLTFGNQYNQPLSPGVLPQSLQRLVFGENYDKPIDENVLPNGLQYLTFGYRYNEPIKPKILPTRLTHLVLGFYFNSPLIKGSLPPNLIHLVFQGVYNHFLNPGVLPESLRFLKLGEYFNQPLTYSEYLKWLKLGEADQPFRYPVHANNTHSNSLPNGLKYLKFGAEYNQPIPLGSLPSSLTTLVFGYDFNQSIIFPENLKKITFGKMFNRPLAKGSLPESLSSISFGENYQQTIDPDVLPHNLSWLTLPVQYDQNNIANILHYRPELEIIYC